MEIEYAKNPQWANAENAVLNLIVKFEEFDHEIPFTASPDDMEAHGRYLFNRAVQGGFGTILEYVPPAAIVPSAVTLRQAKLALLNTGYYMQVEEIIESMEGVEGITARIEWNAPNVQRNSAFLKQMALMLGLSEERLDELFILAATYE